MILKFFNYQIFITMKKKQMKASLLLVSLLTDGFLVTGCTNDDYDFDQIDATMGFGSGELEIPASSTMNIPLSDILELEENGSVKIAANGDYLFQLTGTDASTASPKISPIHLTGRSYTNTIYLCTSSAAMGTRAAGTHLSLVSPKELMFKYNGTDAAVKSLKVQLFTVAGATFENITCHFIGTILRKAIHRKLVIGLLIATCVS